MFHIAIILSIIALSQCEIGADPDPADVDPLTVLIREVKERMRQLSQDIDKDIHVLEQKRKKNVSKHDDFPHPKPLFEGIFTPEQLAKIEKSGSELKQARNIDHRGGISLLLKNPPLLAKLMVDRLLFLNERGVDITGEVNSQRDGSKIRFRTSWRVSSISGRRISRPTSVRAFQCSLVQLPGWGTSYEPNRRIRKSHCVILPSYFILVQYNKRYLVFSIFFRHFTLL